MSHRALGGQFSEQLKLFMSPQELIDRTHKVDSRFYETRSDPGRDLDVQNPGHTPRVQWEAPNSSKYGGNRGITLRKEKQTDLGEHGSHRKAFNKPFATMPPVELQYWRDEHHPTLMQGHHRVAFAEMHDIPHIAVSYRPDHDRSQLRKPRWLRGTM